MFDRLSMVLRACALVAGLLAYWFASSYFSLKHEFSAADLQVFLGYMSAVLLVECIILVALHGLLKNTIVTISLTALLIIVNALSLSLLLNEQFIGMGAAANIAILTAGTLVAFVLVKAFLESGAMRRLIFVAIPLLIVSPALINRHAKPSIDHLKSEHVSQVAFVEKPNVYFVGFESMAAPAVLRARLGFEDPQLPKAFERNNFRVFRNMFTEAAPTTNSMTSLLALDRKYARQTYDFGHTVLFTGQVPSPLIQIFKGNGFTTTTLYETTYFGKQAGPFVDEYRFNETFSICTFMEPYEIAYAFFGVCRFHEWWKQKRKLEGKGIDFLMQAIEEISRRSDPQFLFAHITPLTHTAKNYTGTPQELEAFRTLYAEQDGMAAKNLDRISSYLSKNDPTALLFVFGDHGVWLSRKVAFEEDPKFYIQDRYGIMGGVRPREACASSFAVPVSEKFVTTPQVARMLIRCLAGGRDAFDAGYHHPFPSGRKAKYEDYLYE